MIQDLNELDVCDLQVCVISYGGCGSNAFVDALIKNNYKCRTPIWSKILCHCPEPIDIPVPIIYLYRNPIHAFLSMKRRNKDFWDVNQRKLSNNTKIELSDENLLKLMIQQFYKWINCKITNLLIIKYEELFETDTLI